jgi:hypothetical protein
MSPPCLGFLRCCKGPYAPVRRVRYPYFVKGRGLYASTETATQLRVKRLIWCASTDGEAARRDTTVCNRTSVERQVTTQQALRDRSCATPGAMGQGGFGSFSPGQERIALARANRRLPGYKLPSVPFL